MFNWLRRFWQKSAAEAKRKPVVKHNDSGVVYHRLDGTIEEVTWEELTEVEIMTTDTGPFVEDVYWVLHGANRGCAVAQGAEGSSELLERLQQLPGFNNQAVIDAMSCTDNARFPVWKRKGTV